MIVKKHGVRNTTHEYTMDILSTYDFYRELCFDLETAKVLRRLKPAFITTLVFGVLMMLTNIPFFGTITGIMILVTGGLYLASLLPHMNPIPREASESGTSLTHAPYPLTDKNRDKAAASFEQIFGPPISVTGSLHFVEKPLTTPIMLDGHPVVGAFVEVELFDIHEPSDYRIMLEDGVAVQVERSIFLEMTQTLYMDMDGQKQHVPVLTGRHESILWGLIGDAQVTTAKAVQSRTAKAKVPALRKAIADKEELFAYLELHHMSNNVS